MASAICYAAIVENTLPKLGAIFVLLVFNAATIGIVTVSANLRHQSLNL